MRDSRAGGVGGGGGRRRVGGGGHSSVQCGAAGAFQGAEVHSLYRRGAAADDGVGQGAEEFTEGAVGGGAGAGVRRWLVGIFSYVHAE